ncbi:hypothetical protein BJ742DRAFT_826799 [Cladochytrium replicatum]|nr:hypothetical protein BJ742DRAFT_826799 [Cladochytrium replicatum]
MSWSGFKKAVNRAATTVMQSTGAVEKTIDRDFEEEERRFKNFEGKVERLHKEAKGYLDSVRAMTLAQRQIAETVDLFYDNDAPPALTQSVMHYRDAISKLDDEVRTELDEVYRTAVLDPLGKMVGTFPDVNEAIKKRQKKLLDYDRARSSVRRLVEKPSDDTQKLPKAEQEANQVREIYENLNNQLLTEIPKLIDLRVPFLDPSFEALAKSQLRFNEQAFKRLDVIRGDFANSLGVDGSGDVESAAAQADRRLEGNTEAALAAMRELTICGSH